MSLQGKPAVIVDAPASHALVFDAIPAEKPLTLFLELL
jgi:hypothetical protein